MMTLQLILNVLSVLGFVFTIFGISFYFGGYKLTRITNMIMGFILGSVVGYFVGLVFLVSETMGFLLGGILGLIFSFFIFVYYKYLKGPCLGLLSFIGFFYITYSFLSSMILIILLSSLIAIITTFIAYRYEKVLTIVITSLLGSILILHNIIGLEVGLVTSIFSIILAMGGCYIQSKVIGKKFPGRI